MGISCCCSLAGTRACLTCPNSMAGVYRYQPPYRKEWCRDGVSTLPERQGQEEVLREKLLDLLRTIDEAREKAAQSTLHFGVTPSDSSCPKLSIHRY